MNTYFSRPLGIVALLAVIFSTFLGAGVLRAQYYASPVVQTRSATQLFGNSATLNGTINPNNYEATYWFEYGTDNSLNNRTGSRTVSSASYDVSVSIPVSGLYQNQTYSFRLVAQNTRGTEYGSVLTFITGTASGGPVVTYSATDVGSYGATLWGYSNITGAGAYGWFEYGTSAYSFSHTTSQTSFYSWRSQNFSHGITNLSPGTTYYYRAVVRDGSSLSYGQTLSFVTQGSSGIYLPYMPPTSYDPITTYPYNTSLWDVSYGSDSGYVWTLPMQFVSNSSVTLRGGAYPSGQTMAWFEYGPSQALSWSTERRAVGAQFGATTFSIDVQGLSPGITYYYRAVSQNSLGTFRGALRGFRIDSGYVTPVNYSYQQYQPIAQQPMWYGATGYAPYNPYASMYQAYPVANMWYNAPGSALSASVADVFGTTGVTTTWQTIVIVAVFLVFLGFILVAAVR